MRAAIGKHQAVNAKLSVIDVVAKVAAVAPNRFAITLDLIQTLINPIPDKAALDSRILSEGVPVIGKITQTVAHGMGIFTEDKRPVFICETSPLDQTRLGPKIWALRQVSVGAGVHGTNDVCRRRRGPAALVLDRPGRIRAPRPMIHSIVSRTVARLVAKRPNHDTGVVEISSNHTGHAF